MKVNLDAWADDYAGTLYALARDDFGLFRQLIHPDFLWGWFTDDVSWRSRKELAVGEDGRCRFVWENQLVRKGEALFPEHKPLPFLNGASQSDDPSVLGSALSGRHQGLGIGIGHLCF
jgi:hypothetical protein